MAYVYKQFSTNDIAIVPFNAHKQYDFTSASAVTNKTFTFSSQYTSESISLYSSASSAYGSDTKNVVKYNQIDHLFYRNYIKNIGKKKDFINYLKQRRELYEKVNILSVPSGLYGFEIRKSSFYLSSSKHEITDDSFGNLIISGTDVSNYPDVQQNVFRLDPIKGFKKYDLSIYDGYAIIMEGPYLGNHQTVLKSHYRQGSVNPKASSSYTTTTKFPLGYYPEDEDDSYLLNNLEYTNIKFKSSSLGSDSNKFSSLNFESALTSSIKVKTHKNFNFNSNDDFSISFYITPQATGSDGGMDINEKRYIIAKSGTRTIVSGSYELDTNAGPQYPFEIYMRSQSLYFSRSDGDQTITINGEITSSAEGAKRTSHILCQNSSSIMELWFDGTKIASQTYSFKEKTKNQANLYIGSKGHNTTSDKIAIGVGELEIGGNFEIDNYYLSDKGTIKHFNGQLNNINIWSRAYNTTQITNISESINASPYIGNIFYQSGFATITHPKYHDILRTPIGIGTDGMTIGEDFIVDAGIENGIKTLQFQGSHLIHEHEYQCNIQEHEFNDTTNSSARDKFENPYNLANFTTSSNFRPYVSTIGLYNQAYELLAVAKLGQPIPISDQTDSTFVVRWDT
tara:strand:- start:823 stop:2694 length:1872 start_codon:yes stop_codon:yes gene_type:complete